MEKLKNAELEKYLSKVDSYLRHMPISEKTDILSELKSTFYERLNNGQSAESIVAELGTPKDLAMSYMGESIIKKQGFSMKRFMMLFGFYSFASLTWITIIPSLAVLSLSFFFSSAVSILAGVMGLLKGVIHISMIDDLKFMFFTRELTGAPALIVGLVMAIIFVVIGIICWKAAIWFVRFLHAKKWKLSHESR